MCHVTLIAIGGKSILARTEFDHPTGSMVYRKPMHAKSRYVLLHLVGRMVHAAYPERLNATTRLVLRSLFLTCTDAVVLEATLAKLSLVVMQCLTCCSCVELIPLLKTDFSIASRPPSSICYMHMQSMET